LTGRIATPDLDTVVILELLDAFVTAHSFGLKSSTDIMLRTSIHPDIAEGEVELLALVCRRVCVDLEVVPARFGVVQIPKSKHDLAVAS
jgi:hypothetical protein